MTELLFERLGELAFSRGLPEQALTALAQVGTLRTVPARAVLFREGERHDQVYLVCAGHVALDMAVPRRGAVRILSLGPGDLLGWSPLVGNRLMTATAITLDETELIVFAADEIDRLCTSDAETGFRVMTQVAAALARRLVATRLQLLDLLAETTSAG